MQHSSFRGKLGRQELVGKVVVWGREAGGGRSVVCVGPVASRSGRCAFGVTLEVWAVVAGLGQAFGSVRLTGRLAARLCCVCPIRKCVCRALTWTAKLAGVFRGGRQGVVPRRLCMGGGSAMAPKCVWRDHASRQVVWERVAAGSARTTRPGGRCRCVLAKGNSVPPVVHLVVAHHKDSQCAAVMHRSGEECA